LADDFLLAMPDDNQHPVAPGRKARLQDVPASRMYPSMGLPHTSCSGLGNLDFIRVERPAARITAATDITIHFTERFT
jgi:hypothetical protein